MRTHGTAIIGKNRPARFTAAAAIVALAAIAVSCVNLPPSADGLQDLVREACYEVVILRTEREGIVYERDLPWEALPFNVRNDQYISIGTAFAIAPDRFLTASHVLSPEGYSWVDNDYFIRGADGAVHRVGKVLAFDTARDYALFTVEDFRSPASFEVSRDFEKGQRVIQVGNIYGQGIVAVPGTLLEEFPEERDGRWSYIKTSPPNDKGSSGGPLLDERGRVIGIIDMKDDSFSYSLKMAEVDLQGMSAGVIEDRSRYGFVLMPEVQSPISYIDATVPLPASVREIREAYRDIYAEAYVRDMEALFRSAGGLHPFADGSDFSLYTSTSSPGVQVVFRDDTDGEWKISDLKKAKASGYGGVTTNSAVIDSFTFVDLRVPAADWGRSGGVMSSSETVMDALLSGIARYRHMGGDKVRILSFGAPFVDDTHTDAYGRVWNVAVWTVDFSYELALLLWTPTPSGAACIFLVEDDMSMDWALYDMKRVADLTYIPYAASLEHWLGFLSANGELYGDLGAMSLELDDEGLKVEAPSFSLNLPREAFDISEDAYFALPFWFRVEPDGSLAWKLRKIEFSQADEEAYFTSYLVRKPADSLSRTYLRSWQSISSGSSPYNRVPIAKEDRRDIAVLHPSFDPERGEGFTIYVSVSGTPTDEELYAKISALESGIVLK